MAKPTFGKPRPDSWPTLAQIESGAVALPTTRKVRVQGKITVLSEKDIDETIEVVGEVSEADIIYHAIHVSGWSNVDDWSAEDFKIVDV